jgi:DNA polymerase sigma
VAHRLRLLRERFRDSSVEVFGSSRSELATPGSDIDFSLSLPRSGGKGVGGLEGLRMTYLRQEWEA